MARVRCLHRLDITCRRRTRCSTRDATNFYSYRARINLTTDWRTQSDFGVLRAYAAIIAQNSTGDAGSTGVAGILRAFIQFAGFTVGHAVSYFDFFNGADYGYAPSVWGASTGVNGTDLIAYTWQLGNGWSMSVDMEDSGSGYRQRSPQERDQCVAPGQLRLRRDRPGRYWPDAGELDPGLCG